MDPGRIRDFALRARNVRCVHKVFCAPLFKNPGSIPAPYIAGADPGFFLFRGGAQKIMCPHAHGAVVAQWTRPQTLNREVPGSNLLAAAV